MKNKIDAMTIVFFISCALGISIEQYFRCGSFFQLNDLHHETGIVALVFGAFSIALLYCLKKLKNK